MTLAYSLNYCLYLSVIYTYFHMGDILSTWAWSSSLFNYLYHHYVPIFNKHESVLIKGYYLKNESGKKWPSLKIDNFLLLGADDYAHVYWLLSQICELILARKKRVEAPLTPRWVCECGQAELRIVNGMGVCCIFV